MDGVMHPSVEQAIGRDRIRNALKRYENNPADEHDRGIVRAVNADGSYEVLLDGDVQTARCAPYAKAMVGDRVIVVTTKGGENVLLGRLGGETETILPTIAERFEALEPVVLYDNASGTTGTITLAETAANFAFIDIMYSKLDGGSGGYNVCRVYDPNGKRASFNQINPVSSASTFQIVFSKIVISGTSITWDAKGCTINVSVTNINIYSVTSDEGKQLIYKIVGYR